MSFFDSMPPPPPPPEPQQESSPPWQQPDNMVPGSVARDLLVARSEAVAIAIGSIKAYPNGFEFTVHVRLRQPSRDRIFHVDPFSGPGSQAYTDVLRLGLLFADGRRGATLDSHRFLDPMPADRLLISQQGGGGSPRSWDQRLWVHPLPPEGPVTLFVSWLAEDVPESSVELDGAEIRAAAERAVDLWPDDPGEDTAMLVAKHVIQSSGGGRFTGPTTYPGDEGRTDQPPPNGP